MQSTRKRPKNALMMLAEGGPVLADGWTSPAEIEARQRAAWEQAQSPESGSAYQPGYGSLGADRLIGGDWAGSLGFTPTARNAGNDDYDNFARYNNDGGTYQGSGSAYDSGLDSWMAQNGYQVGAKKGSEGSNAFTRGSTYDYQVFDPSGNAVQGANSSYRDNNSGALKSMATVAALAGGAGALSAAGVGGGAAAGGTAAGGAGGAATGAAGATGGAASAAGAGSGAASAAGAGMSYLDWAQLAAGVVNAGMGSKANRDASRGQQAAADAALALQREQYDQTREDNRMRMQVGDNALSRLAGMGDFQAPTSAEVMAEPGYQFGLEQGQANIQNTAAAKGGLYSGNALKALTKFGGDYATGRYNDAYNRSKAASDTQWGRLSSLAGIGQTAQTQVNGAGNAYANNAGNIGQNNANAQGAAGIANANIWGSALNQGVSSYIDYGRRNPNAAGGGTIRNGSFGGSVTGDDLSQAYADGGPVRIEPKIGTRGPMRSGGGGGMSREAILAALNAAQAMPEKDGIAALPGNPVTDPAGVRKRQLESVEKRLACGGAVRKDYSNGGMVKGPGGPREDKIKARLSNGEHVFDAASVTAFGDGDNERGQHKLNALRMLLKGA